MVATGKAEKIVERIHGYITRRAISGMRGRLAAGKADTVSALSGATLSR
jgi:hypothetical protein